MRNFFTLNGNYLSTFGLVTFIVLLASYVSYLPTSENNSKKDAVVVDTFVRTIEVNGVKKEINFKITNKPGSEYIEVSHD